MSLSPGPFNYNRFDGIPTGNSMMDSYRAIYESKDAKPDFLDMDKDDNKKESFKKAVKDKESGKGEKECTCEEWVESLLDEGYDLSDYTWDDMERMFLEGIPTGAARIRATKPGKKVDVFAYDRKLQAQGKLKGKKLPPAPKDDDVKEHVCQYLVDEGYTNNEVSAEVLFNHMSDEWLSSIVGNIEEAMRPGERQRKVAAKVHDPYVRGGSKTRAIAHNVAVRGDVRPGDPSIKSRGGGGVTKDKGMGYGDRGAGNKARRRMGQEPLRGSKRPG